MTRNPSCSNGANSWPSTPNSVSPMLCVDWHATSARQVIFLQGGPAITITKGSVSESKLNAMSLWFKDLAVPDTTKPIKIYYIISNAVLQHPKQKRYCYSHHHDNLSALLGVYPQSHRRWSQTIHQAQRPLWQNRNWRAKVGQDQLSKSPHIVVRL